jgi:predicted MFS family arabinose efflux permease
VRDGSAPAEARSAALSPRRYYVVAVLALVYMVSSIDRMLISTVAEPIKLEFQLSDSALGVLTGLVFSVSYTIFGIPLGVLIDRVNRTRLLAGLISLWSGLTFLSGFASSYLMLAAARAGVGASEAGASPAAMSLITDYFPRAQRGRALSLFYVSTPIGVSIGLAMGTYMAGHFGWRSAFFIAGIPGLVLALLLILTVREPRRGAMEPAAQAAPERPGFAATIGTIWRLRPLALIIMAGMSVVVAQAGLNAFATPFLMRIHDVPIQQAGYALGLANFLPGIAGVLIGGLLADRMARRSATAGPATVGLLMLLAAPVGIVALLLDDWRIAVALLGLHYFLNATYYGTHFSTFMSLAPVRMRGTLAAVMAVLMTLMGYGMGPVLAGAASDLYAALGVAEPLRWALVTIVSIFFLAGAFFLATARAIARLPEAHA